MIYIKMEVYWVVNLLRKILMKMRFQS